MPSRADIDEAFHDYHSVVNMSASELNRWARTRCSQLSDSYPSAVERNAHLLSTPRAKWTAREVEWAARTRAFIARMRGVNPGKAAASGCPARRDIALKNWGYDPDKSSYRKNSGRVRVYDAAESATGMREAFADRPVQQRHHLRFGYPPVMQNVGDCLAVAYGSDKWEKPDRAGRRKVELYKHLAESRNRALVLPGLLRDEDDPTREWDTIGPLVSLEAVPMPRHFAVLGLFEECNFKLYCGGTDAAPHFGRGRDAGIVRVEVRHGMLGASAVQYNRVEPYKSERRRCQNNGEEPPDYNEPFLLVYTEADGVMMIIVGERLDIARDGIVG